MKEFIISEAQTERAVLVGLVTPEQNEQKVKEYLDELAFLADTAGVESVKRFTIENFPLFVAIDANGNSIFKK